MRWASPFKHMTPATRAALREWRETETDFIQWYKRHAEEPRFKEEKRTMAYELMDGQGLLFSEEAQGNRPNYRGRLMINGKLIKLVGWTKQGKRGTFISLKVDEPKPQNIDSADNIEY